MIDSMREASSRGLSLDQWLLGEMERDFNNFYAPYVEEAVRQESRRVRRLMKRQARRADGSHDDIP